MCNIGQDACKIGGLRRMLQQEGRALYWCLQLRRRDFGMALLFMRRFGLGWVSAYMNAVGAFFASGTSSPTSTVAGPQSITPSVTKAMSRFRTPHPQITFPVHTQALILIFS